MITVYPHPHAAFTYSPNPVSILTPLVQDSDRSTGKFPIVQWNWNFGDGNNKTEDSTSSSHNPSHLYSDTGTLCTILTVTDEHGCVDTATGCVDVQPFFTFYIPNAFTPNEDGLNDVFMPKGSYVKDYQMYIFDRWGMQLFYSNAMDNGWNGRLNNSGKKYEEDTYIYLIYVTDTGGNKHTYNGMVNLIK